MKESWKIFLGSFFVLSYIYSIKNNIMEYNKEFIEGIVSMMNGNDDDYSLASVIFDDILKSDEEFENFIEQFEKYLDDTNQNFDIMMDNYKGSDEIMIEFSKINKAYLKLCLLHTKWRMKHESHPLHMHQ